MRVGMGHDMHRLVAGRPLVLGGVSIPFELGLAGHSDADVLVHAICDALLGAAGLGDIGMHFPDTDPALSGRSSLRFLEDTVREIKAIGFSVVNIDATIVAQAPRIGPYRSAMQRQIAETIGIETDQVNIKATTTEGLDAAGEGKGIAATAVVLIR